MVDPQDAESISIPFALLASKDEDAEAVKGFGANLKGERYIETFGDMPHVSNTILAAFSNKDD